MMLFFNQKTYWLICTGTKKANLIRDGSHFKQVLYHLGHTLALAFDKQL